MTAKAKTAKPKTSKVENVPIRTAIAVHAVNGTAYDPAVLGTIARTGRIVVVRTTTGVVEVFPGTEITWAPEVGDLKGSRFCADHQQWAVVRSVTSGPKGTCTIRCLGCEKAAMQARNARRKAAATTQPGTEGDLIVPTATQSEIAERIDRIMGALAVARTRTRAEMIASVVRHINAADWGPGEKGRTAKAKAFAAVAQDHHLSDDDIAAMIA